MHLGRWISLAAVLTLSASAEKPQLIATFNDKPLMVQLRDGTLWGLSIRSVEGIQEPTVRRSTDGGRTWTEAEALLKLDKTVGGWAGPLGLVDREDEVHLFFLNDAISGIVTTGEEARPRVGQTSEHRLDIWHTKSTDGRTKWQTPKQIWQGYTGALNSVVQLRSGRILLPFSYLTNRNWSNRGEGLDTFTFVGQYDSTLVYSDDNGATWQLSTAKLKVPVPDIVSAYGAVEPVVLELKGDRVWMLIRTQQGRFYESLSPDGATWSTPKPSPLISSDSPAGLARAADGRIVLFWNNSLRFPYAYGGRHVLHAAVSDNEGKTWRGYREVARDPLRDEPPPSSGDHGTAYPFPTALKDGKIIFTTGQGTGRIACMLLDPAWLCETRQADDFSHGLDEWSVFGTKGVELAPHPDKTGARVLKMARTTPDWPTAAVWNFPLGASGNVKLRMKLGNTFAGVRIGLTDHYSVPFDPEEGYCNVYNVVIGKDGALAGNNTALRLGEWHTVELAWDGAKRECRVSIDGQAAGTAPQLRDAPGVCYLRIRSLADTADPEGTDKEGCFIESVAAELE